MTKTQDGQKRPEPKPTSLPKPVPPVPSPKQEEREPQVAKQKSTTPVETPETKKVEVEVSKPESPQVSDTPDETNGNDLEWEKKAIFEELKAPHPPDEVGKPLPADYNDEVLLPRKWDAKCIESDYVNADNIEEYVKPIHETKYWPLVGFDPAFVRDGKLPCGDPVSELPPRSEEIVRSDSSESGEVHEQRSKRGHSSDDNPAERPLKRQRSQSPSNVSHGGSRDEHSGLWDTLGARNRRPRRDSSKHRRAEARETDHRRSPERTASYHRDRSRDRSRGRSRSRSRTPASRRSSVSNASSGLDSLEAELLGRDIKAKSPDETPKRKPSGSGTKPKRRQTKLDSAYSRRW
ncbi:hypothetical protein NM208_g16533 [Fusarium decemcellulare]|uniref:Uncharacterized protein n=1 Tax=Fusarium decemcellulare TaxID=57161 RepID=A0ACC1RCH1_9HYPO|nr:hypothetical protein NM208_g16533 [Fusarium decemcellulare]